MKHTILFLVLFLLVLRLLLGFPFLRELVFVLELTKELLLTFLGDLFAVRLKDALLEHAGRENRKHSLSLLHLLLLGHDLHVT